MSSIATRQSDGMWVYVCPRCEQRIRLSDEKFRSKVIKCPTPSCVLVRPIREGNTIQIRIIKPKAVEMRSEAELLFAAFEVTERQFQKLRDEKNANQESANQEKSLFDFMGQVSGVVVKELERQQVAARQMVQQIRTETQQTIAGYFEDTSEKLKALMNSTCEQIAALQKSFQKKLAEKDEYIQQLEQARREPRLFASRGGANQSTTENDLEIQLSDAGLEQIRNEFQRLLETAQLDEVRARWLSLLNSRGNKDERALMIEHLPELFDVIELELASWENSQRENLSSETRETVIELLREQQQALHQWQEKHGLVRFPELGESFDYRIHRKLKTEFDDSLPPGDPGRIERVVRIGYRCLDSEVPLRNSTVVVRVPPV